MCVVLYVRLVPIEVESRYSKYLRLPHVAEQSAVIAAVLWRSVWVTLFLKRNRQRHTTTGKYIFHLTLCVGLSVLCSRVSCVCYFFGTEIKLENWKSFSGFLSIDDCVH